MQTIDTIRQYHRSDNPFGPYVADPHTAVGLCAASRHAQAGAQQQQQSQPLIQIILSTAHPAKFSSAVEEALKQNSTFDFDRDVLPEEFKGLLEKKRRVIDVPGPEPELTKEVVAEQVAKLFGKAAVSASSADCNVNTASV